MKDVSNDVKRVEEHDSKVGCWIRFMELGAKTGCHQMPERSFFIKGYQFPVCARCVGVFLGYLIAPIVYVKIGFSKLKSYAFAGLIIMFLDWLFQAIHIKESTNVRRFFTGIAGGFGSMIVFLKLLMISLYGVRKLFSK